MIKFEIGYPVYGGTLNIATKEDLEKGLCDMEWGDLSRTFDNALKKAIKFLRSNPQSCVTIQDYDTEYDCACDYCEYVEIENGVALLNGKKLTQKWQDLFNNVKTK
jgi:hypothetical protein